MTEAEPAATLAPLAHSPEYQRELDGWDTARENSAALIRVALAEPSESSVKCSTDQTVEESEMVNFSDNVSKGSVSATMQGPGVMGDLEEQEEAADAASECEEWDDDDDGSVVVVKNPMSGTLNVEACQQADCCDAEPLSADKSLYVATKGRCGKAVLEIILLLVITILVAVVMIYVLYDATTDSLSAVKSESHQHLAAWCPTHWSSRAG